MVRLLLLLRRAAENGTLIPVHDGVLVNIAIFRSRDDGASDLAPLYPYQQRVGVFQALVNTISNTMTLSEEAALRKCEAGIAEIVCLVPFACLLHTWLNEHCRNSRFMDRWTLMR